MLRARAALLTLLFLLTTGAYGVEVVLGNKWARVNAKAPRIAVVVRGLAYAKNSKPESTAAFILNNFTHNTMRRALPSIIALTEHAASKCGYTSDIFIITYSDIPSSVRGEARRGLPSGVLDVLRDVAAIILLIQSSEAFGQFSLLLAGLRELNHLLLNYDLILVTRDDFVYAPLTWDILATRYNRSAFNIAYGDCTHHDWDGLHVLPPAALADFTSALKTTTLVDHKQHAHFLRVPGWQRHLWFEESFGQPDRCTTPLGFIDRGLGNPAGPSSPRLNRCCENATEAVRKLGPVRSCPQLA